MQYKDYYQVLGVNRDAPQDEIRSAYRKLARKFHPDINQDAGAEEMFKEISEAYEALKDPDRRAAYDQLGSQFKAGQDFRPPPDWDAGFERHYGFTEHGDEGFSDFFETLFGETGHGRRTRQGGFSARGRDHQAKVQIDLQDTYQGATRSITLRHAELDESGRVVQRSRNLNVRIPKGVRPGQLIRLTGHGDPGIGGGPAGDMYLEIGFRPDPAFEIDGLDVLMTLPVAPWEAALGAKVQVRTPSGPVDVTIPAGSQQGRKLRLKGRGIPSRTPGDLYFVLQVVLPPADTDTAKRVYREMADKLAFDPRKQAGG